MNKTYTVTVTDTETTWRNSAGKLHREDGPAVEFADGTKEWYLNGRLHRADGPALEGEGVREWYLNNKRHRTDGPAIVWKDGTEFFYISGKNYTREGFIQAMQPAQDMTMADIEKALGKRIKIVK
jgi:hypothetical protein